MLGAQVVDVLGIRDRLEVLTTGDLEPEAFQAAVLAGVVGHQPHRRDPEVVEYLRADSGLSGVDRQTQLDVGIDGVVPFFVWSP